MEFPQPFQEIAVLRKEALPATIQPSGKVPRVWHEVCSHRMRAFADAEAAISSLREFDER